MSDKYKLFVYGTLRKHEQNHFLLDDSRCLAQQAWVYGELFDTGLGYPTMKGSHLENKVYGELYEINPEQFKELDELEDYIPGDPDNLYNRIEQEIHTDSGIEHAFVYVSNRDDLLVKPIVHGDWKLNRLLERKPDKIFYFAYGSCMDMERFKAAKADQYFRTIRGVGMLKGYSMKYVFPGVDGGRADIVENGGETEGILYEIPYDGVEYLFQREGFYGGWYRPVFVDIDLFDGRRITNVLTFHVYNKKEEIAPPLHYAAEILRGAKGRLSEKYFAQLEEQLKGLGLDI
ncbi:MAG: gamma-glutamylcyclotransferase [Cytobacillus gottheilii]|uniref:gamma-glutamylcyclotransferase n=1 Tax=Cytobacillus gottheilii TaxID=859144 RepID=UPI00082F4C76|nr:gamma-glutamylcyclotransferase [Cytobacillus gottheilii]